MKWEEIKGLIKLHGNQKFANSLEQIEVDSSDTLDKEVYNGVLSPITIEDWPRAHLEKMVSLKSGNYYWVSGDKTNFVFDFTKLSYVGDKEFKEKRLAFQLGKACHSTISSTDSSTSFLLQLYPIEDSGLEYILWLYSEESPFKEVTRSCTFLPIGKRFIGVLFRDMNVPIKVMTNLLIWSRGFHVFKSFRMLDSFEKGLLSKKELVALSPLFDCTNDGSTWRWFHSFGDSPIYQDVRGYYAGASHPNDFIKYTEPPEGFDLRRAGKTRPNPCNALMSRRKTNFFFKPQEYYQHISKEKENIAEIGARLRRAIDEDVTYRSLI